MQADATVRRALPQLHAAASGDSAKLVAVARLALAHDEVALARKIAEELHDLSPADPGLVWLEQSLSRLTPAWHFKIIRDDKRNQAYLRAIEEAVTPQTRVLDIGTGSGLLAMIAARAGAAEVYACESSEPLADIAREIVATNGLAGRIRIIPKASQDVGPAELDGGVDLIVSEIVANDLLSEGVIETLADAALRLLKPGGRLIPSRGQVRVALAHWAALDSHYAADALGFDLRALNALRPVPLRPKIDDPVLTLSSEAHTLFEFTFGERQEAASRQVRLVSTGPVNGVAQWISFDLDDGNSYENRPGAGATSCWAVLFYPCEPDFSEGTDWTIFGVHQVSSLAIWATRMASPGR